MAVSTAESSPKEGFHPHNQEKRTHEVAEVHTEDVRDVGREKGTSLTSTPASEQSEEFVFTFGKFLGILSFSLGYISDRLITSFVGATIHAVNNDIGPSSNYVWMALGQPLGTAALTPLCGRLGDIYGRRNFIIIGNVIAIIGCVIAATANRVETVIGGTVLIGISGAFRQIAWTSLGELVPKLYRGFAFGLLSSSLSIATSFGPVVGFAFVRNGSWRPIYWLPFAIDVAALILTVFYYHPLNQYIHEEGTTVWRQVMETDFTGCFLFVAGLVLLMLGLSFGGGTLPWASAGTLAPLLIGAAFLVACGVFEAFSKIKWPIFPPSIFRNIQGFTLVQVAVFLDGMVYYAAAVLWPGQVQSLFTRDPLIAGWYSGISGFAGLICSPIGGYLIAKIRHVRYQIIFYVFVVMLFSGLQATVTASSNVSSTILMFLLFMGVTGVNIASITIVQASVKHEYIGIATGVTCCIRSFGGSVGQVVYTTILNNRVRSYLASHMTTSLTNAGVALSSIPGIVQALLSGQSNAPALGALSSNQLEIARGAYEDAYVNGYRLVYLVTIAFGAVCLICIWFVLDIDHLLTSKVDIKLKEGAALYAETDTGEGHIIRRDERSA